MLCIFVLGFLDFPTNHFRTAHVTFHLVHPLQRGRIATVVVALLLIDNFETPIALFVHRPIASGQSACRRLTVFLQSLWDDDVHLDTNVQSADPRL